MIILKEMYGDGVCDVVFSEGQEFVAVSNKVGADVLNIVDKNQLLFGLIICQSSGFRSAIKNNQRKIVSGALLLILLLCCFF